MSYRGTNNPKEETGLGWGGLVASKAEIRAEREQQRLEQQAREGRQIALRLETLTAKCRDEEHQISYQDLLAVRGIAGN